MIEIVEREIISCILQKPDELMIKSVSQIKPDDFQFPTYRHIYESMYKLFLEGKPIDIVSVAANSSDDYSQLLIDTQFAAITTANFNNHLQTLKELSQKAKAQVIVSKLYDMLCKDSIEDCREQATELLQALGTRQNVVQANAEEGMNEFLKSLDEPLDYFETGFSLLDKYAMIEKGDFIIVGGRPSGGKTALTLQIASYMAKTKNVVYFSCETKKIKLYNRIISHVFGIDLELIKRRKVPNQIKEFLKHEKVKFKEKNLSIVESADWTVAEIKAKAIEAQADIIFIDYLTMLKADGKSLYEIATKISRGLHIMAQQSGITVVALSQLSRQGEGEPDNTALRESGQIEQDADLILMIWNAKNDKKQIPGATHKLRITKNKEGELKLFGMHFDGSKQTFSMITNKEA